MAEQNELLRAFVEFADTLVADYDVVDFMHRLAVRCVELLDVSDAGVMLTARDGKLRYLASSSERMRVVELLELQHEQGPCFEAQQSGTAQISRSADEADQRWPQFGPPARNAGFESMVGIPLRLRAEVVGVLNLFSTQPGGMHPDDEPVAQALADIATIGLLQERAIHDKHVIMEQLEGALQSRVIIEQAKGIVAERRGITVDDAFAMLRDYARSHNRKLTDTAREVIAGSLLPEMHPR
jgi:transcriptional regulator with GAF, ATPase, and Fis domain